MRENESSPEHWMATFQATGDPAAFDPIVSRFLGPALSVAGGILGDRALAEDAVQEAFIRVVRNRGRYRAPRPFAGWFYAILRNVCTDMLRQRHRESRLLRELEAEGAGTVEGVEAEPGNDPGEAALGLLERLPDGERAVLTLQVVHGLALAAAAEALGISYESAKKRAQRGLRRLRTQANRGGG